MSLAVLKNVWNLDASLHIELVVPVETPSNNVIKGMHFHAYKHLRRQWRAMMLAAMQGRVPAAPLELAFLVITRECAGGGLDWDNAYGGLKPMLDCLVCASPRNPDGLGVIQDDKLKNMPYPPFVVQRAAKPGQGKTTVQVYALQSEGLAVPA